MTMFTSYVGIQLYGSAGRGQQRRGHCGYRLRSSAESRVLLSIEVGDHPGHCRRCYHQRGRYDSQPQ